MCRESRNQNTEQECTQSISSRKRYTLPQQVGRGVSRAEIIPSCSVGMYGSRSRLWWLSQSRSTHGSKIKTKRFLPRVQKKKSPIITFLVIPG